MPVYTPITRADQLPDVGTGIETDVFDAKTEYLSSSPFHVARDLAAFANHLGGSVLVGAASSKGVISRYKGLTEDERTSTEMLVRNAAKDRCHPPIVYSLQQLVKGDFEVLVINVEASLGTPVAVRGTGLKETDRYGGEVFVFPRRSGSDTPAIPIESIAMYMEPQIRRMYLLLSRIPIDANVLATVQRAGSSHYGRLRYLFKGVAIEDNQVTFEQCEGNKEQHTYPLDRVSTVFFQNRPRGGWRVLIEGFPEEKN